MTQNTKISGSTLKIIAVISMTIDHIAASLLYRLITLQPAWSFVNSENAEIWRYVYYGCRVFGRLAFPIYCFLLVEGFLHTGSKLKYGIRLLVFAFISEIPFDMAFQGALFDSSDNNVYFTLFLGLTAICLIDPILKKMDQVSDSVIFTISWFLLKGLIVAAIGGGLAWIAEYVLNTDYGFFGVAAIVVMYLLRSEREIGMLASVLVLTGASAVEAFAVFDVLLVRYYNGERGRQRKYFFYFFYPAHLLILGLICYFLGIM